MPALRAGDWRDDTRLDPEALEHLVLVYLEHLAMLARTQGQQARAARLLEAAALLHDEPRTSELSAREWQVALLVARGYSNRQIAGELVISNRTVDSHVTHILHKLGLVSRAQIAAWVVTHQRHLRVLT